MARIIESVNANDPRDRGYHIAVVETSGRERSRGAFYASCNVHPSTYRLRYGATPEEAVQRLRDWIEASG